MAIKNTSLLRDKARVIYAAISDQLSTMGWMEKSDLLSAIDGTPDFNDLPPTVSRIFLDLAEKVSEGFRGL